MLVSRNMKNEAAHYVLFSVKFLFRPLVVTFLIDLDCAFAVQEKSFFSSCSLHAVSSAHFVSCSVIMTP